MGLTALSACFAISPLAVRNSGGAAVLVCVLWSASLLPLCIGAGVVRAIAFQQVDHAPHAEASAKGNHEGLQSVDSRSEKLHIFLRFSG